MSKQRRRGADGLAVPRPQAKSVDEKLAATTALDKANDDDDNDDDDDDHGGKP
jgi:hypothetical protein